MNWPWNIFLFVMGVIVGIVLITFDFEYVGSRNLEYKNIEISFVEMAGIALTAATIVLGGVALIVATAAVFGYQSIRAESVKSAEHEVGKRLDDSLDQKVDVAILERLGPRIDLMIENAGKGGLLDKALSRAMYGSTEDELSADFDPDDDGER